MKLGESRGAGWHLHPVLLVCLLTALAAGESALVAGCALALWVHESAHLRAAALRGVRVLRMDLTPIGALALLDPSLETRPADEALIALAGPAASALCWMAALSAAQLCVRFGLSTAAERARRFSDLNFGLMTLNLLPALPLDGGRALRAWLSGPMGLRRATVLSAALGLALGVFLLLVGLCVTVSLGRFALSYAAMGVSLSLGALTCLRQSAALTVRAQALRPGPVGKDGPVPVRRLAVDAAAPVAPTLARLWQPGYYELLIFRHDHPIATLTREALAAAAAQGARTVGEAALLCARTETKTGAP